MGLPTLLWAPDYMSSATITVSNLTGTAADLAAADEGTYLTVTANGNAVISFDLASAKSVHAICLAGENLAGLAVTVDRSSDGSSWSSVTLASSQSPLANNLANAIFFAAAATYRYFRITLASATTSVRLYHATPATNYTWPGMEDGYDPVGYNPDVTVLESPQGHLLGLQRNSVTRKLSIDFGQITATEYAVWLQWLDDCVRMPQGFFFVPDTSATVCHFGRADFKQYVAPQKIGLYEPTPITMIARVA